MEDKNNQLNKENIALKYSLQGKITSFGEIIKPGFNFGTVTKSGTPKEYFAAAVLNKLYSLNISTENVLLANDVFLAQYLYRYIYELYIKVFIFFPAHLTKKFYPDWTTFLKTTI